MAKSPIWPIRPACAALLDRVQPRRDRQCRRLYRGRSRRAGRSAGHARQWRSRRRARAAGPPRTARWWCTTPPTTCSTAASRSPTRVDAPTGPLGAYGRSKLAGEQALRDSGADHLIFRTAWVYAAHGHNFLRTMLRLGAERDELRVVADQHGAPTDTDADRRGQPRRARSLAGQRRSDAAQQLGGTHHLVASGATTWHGFASAIFEQAARAGPAARASRAVRADRQQRVSRRRRKRPAWSLLDNHGLSAALRLYTAGLADGWRSWQLPASVATSHPPRCSAHRDRSGMPMQAYAKSQGH